jgi:hypothetical protein
MTEQGGEDPAAPGPDDGEQVAANPAAPAGEAEDADGSDSGEGAPQTEEELRARLEEEMKKVRVEDFLLQSISGLLNLTARRLAKEDERDLDQARIGIDAISAWGDLLPEEAAKQVAQAVAELKMLYAQLAQGGGGPGGGPGGTPAPDDEAESPAAGEGGPGAPKPGGEPPPRLWTPGSG